MNWWPSLFSPRNATKRPFLCTRRESYAMLSTTRSVGPRIWRGETAATSVLSCMRNGQTGAARSTVRCIGCGHSSGRRFANVFTRLEIEVTRGFLGDARKDRTRDEAAVIQFRIRRLRVVENNDPDEFRMVGRKITAKRNDIFSVLVSTVRIDFLGCAGFTRDGETRNRCGGGGTAIAHHPAEGVADLRRGLRRNDLAQYSRRKRRDRFAIL